MNGEIIRATFYGGAEEVGRSAILLEETGQAHGHGGRGKPKSMLLDCGIKLGEVTQYPALSDNDIKNIQGIVITHAHLDHSGYLPHIYAAKAKPTVYATKPTRDLAGVLLSDYRRIQKEKLFKQQDVDNALQQMNMVEYHEPTQGPFEFTLHNAGHILGSAMVRINEKGGILYTGDICTRNTRILDGCEQGLSAETLIMETTYAGKHDVLPTMKESAKKLVGEINKTLNEGGHVIVPSFAVGRAQEILLLLDDYMRSGALGKTKIYIDGMIGKAMRIYRHNAYYANDDIKKRILMSEDDPFNSPFFFHPKSKEREDVLAEPAIIVTTSGMLSGGPALFYIEKLAGNPKNKLIFVGYQAEGTRGRALLNGQKRMRLGRGRERRRHGEKEASKTNVGGIKPEPDEEDEFRGQGEKEIEINMKVAEVRISGHADHDDLVRFVKGIKRLKRIFLVHGEKSSEFKDEIERKYEIIVPRLTETHGII
ncbi:MAG: MBL fold metallo-hydrolase RNA specificity domain-containing protein [Candidatus Micrarchaeota archaeon]